MKTKKMLWIAPVLIIVAQCSGDFFIEGARVRSMALEGDPAAVSQDSRFFVTPRWLPDGGGFLVSGRFGVGLYQAGLQGTEATGIRAVDESFYGAVRFGGDGRTLCLDSGESSMEYEVREDKVISKPASTNCPDPEVVSDEGPGKVLFSSGQREVLYHPHGGEIEVIDSGGSVIVDSSAWDVTVSPDGERVAYSTGHLHDASLKVLSLRDGAAVQLCGVHPAWFPDGKVLVYAAARAADPASHKIVESDLYAFDVETGAVVRLTFTPDRIEMEPDVSPDGSRILFSDWKTGVVYVAAVRREVKP